ncbi:MAG: protein kinase [Bryobacteraceae bacterium]|jgi:tetratricopeptide (TPR) repeat protein
MDLTPEQFARLNQWFDKAVDLPLPERAALIEEVRRVESGEMADRLASLLEANDRTTGTIGEPLVRLLQPGILQDTGVFGEGELILGRFRIVRVLGRGGMGEVYEAEDLELKGRVALKTLLPEIASDPQMIARFKQEIQLSRRIAHPNVCKVFDLARHPADGSPPQRILLSMEFLPGETLGQKLVRVGCLSVDEALPIVRQMAAALDAAHAAGVIHRDFKPSNVMLASSGEGVRAVVTDFGLARKASLEGESTATLPERLAGTLNYMAPELLTGRPATVASDVYALGMVIYRMLTGTRPFVADEPLAAALRRGQEPVPAPRTVVPGLDERWNGAVVRCLDADPSLRFAAAGDVVKAVEGEPVAAVPGPATVWTPRKLGVAALAIALAGVAGYALWPRHYQPPAEAARFYRTGTDDLEAGAYFAATKELGEAARLAPDFSMAYARLAEAWTDLDAQGKASQEMQLARRYVAGARLSEMDRLYLDAVDLTITRQFPEAARKYEAMLTYGGVAQPEVRLDLGHVYDLAGKPDEAIRNYLIAAQGPPRNAAAWLRLAVLYSLKSDAKNADRAFAQAEQLYELTSNQEGLTEVAYQRGADANRRAKMPAAEGFLREALRITQVTHNAQQEIRAKLQLGTVAILSGDADSAKRYAEEAIDAATLNRIESLATRGLLVLGEAFSRKRDFEQAEKYYAMGLGLARQDDSRRLIAGAQLRLASLHEQERQIDKWVPEAQEAIAFYLQNNFARETVQCQVLLGRAKLYQGQYDAALGFYRPALAAAEKLQDSYQMMLVQEGMGTAMLGLEQFPEALEHYEKELELAAARRDIEHVGYGALQCGMTLWPLGRYAEAPARFDQAEAAAAKFEDLRFNINHQRAELALSEGKYPEAVATCNRLLSRVKSDESDTMADLNRMLGLALIRIGRKQEGRQRCERSFEMAARASNAGVLLGSILGVAEARLETGDWRGVLAAIQSAGDGLSKLPDSNWRAKAMQARASEALHDQDGARREALAAQAQLDAMERQWGKVAFQLYHGRPDLQRFWRPLLRMVSASQSEEKK